MTDNKALIERVQKYLAFRDSVMPKLEGIYTSTIHDIDAGSLGHFSLHDTDVAELITALERAELELTEQAAAIDAAHADIYALIDDLSLGRANGKIYTYANVQARLSHTAAILTSTEGTR